MYDIILKIIIEGEKMERKKILFCVIATLIILILIIILPLSILNKTVIIGIILLITILVMIFLAVTLNKEKEKIINKNFVLDITNKSKDFLHLRITEDNELICYKNIMKYWFIFPSIFGKIPTADYAIGLTPTYKIIIYEQLSKEIVEQILEKIKKLDDDDFSNTIVNLNGIKSKKSKQLLDEIFLNLGYNIQ